MRGAGKQYKQPEMPALVPADPGAPAGLCIYVLLQASCGFPILPEEEREAVRILEALLAAGFRPTVYRQVAQGPFRHSSDTRVRAEFDPFTGDPTYSKLGTRQVGVGAGHSPA